MKNIDDTLVSVVLLAEDTGEKNTIAALDNVLQQNHKNLEIIVSTFFDNSVLRNKYESKWNIKFITTDPSKEYLSDAINLSSGSIIFYKTVTNVLWHKRHIQAHLEEFRNNKNAGWSLSRIEYRDVDNPNHPLNTIGYRIENPPELDRIILDEICHLKKYVPDWSICFEDNPQGKNFNTGKIIKFWVNKNIVGINPKELTVVQWIKVTNKQDPQQLVMSIGVPANTEIKEENKLVGDDIEIVRTFPTIVGNKFLDEQYNDKMRSIVESTIGITDIGIKRTIGMGDIVLVEPIIKKLREKYQDAEITFHTAKTDIVEYFVHQPDCVKQIDQNSLLQDTLSQESHQLKFDLDLAYESRLKTSFVDSYAEVCGLKWNNYKEKYPMLKQQHVKDLSHLQPYVVVVPDGSGWVGKTWGQPNWKAVVLELKNRGYTVIEPGFSDYSGLTESKYQKCDLDTLVSLISQCCFYMGGDNGPMHIARGLNIPCIIVAGAALPYYSNPNRENVFYVQDNSLDCLGCKHDQFFNQIQGQLTFVPQCVQEEKGLCMKTLKPEHVIAAMDKFLDEPKSILTQKPTKFYFNIPGFSYYREDETDLIMRENPKHHPDQDKDISEEYAPRWEELYEKYSKPFIETVFKEYSADIGFSNPGPKLLDIGCNIGLVVKAGLERGFEASGCDVNEASIKKGNELFGEDLNMICADFESTYSSWDHRQTEEECTYDILTCNQTLEHISNPIYFLEVCNMILRDNGFMFIGIPSMDETDARFKWHKWQTMGTGEHITLFTNKSFNWLMDKTGFEFKDLQSRDKGIFVKCWKKER